MHRAVIGFLPVLFFVSLIGTARAQYVFPSPTPTPTQTPKPSPTTTPTPGPPPCPTVIVRAGAGRRTRDGEKVNFMANIAGGDPKVVPTIIWSTSAGVITQGQSTRQIEVDTTGAGSTPEQEVRADIWIGGYAPACVLQASGKVAIIPPAVKFTGFGELDDETLKKNIDQIAAYLAQMEHRVYLIAYAGRNNERGYAVNWLTRIRDALVTKGIGASRMVVLDGGFRETPHIDFWLVPRGSEPPGPTPTIKRSEIVYPNTRPPRKP